MRIDEAASLPRVGKHSLQIIQVASKLSSYRKELTKVYVVGYFGERNFRRSRKVFEK